MAYKDLLVVVDLEENARERVALAASLAQRFAAHLVGLYVDALYLEPRAENREQIEICHRQFSEVAAGHSLSAEWRFAGGHPAEAVAVHGRYSDLVILGQLDPEDARQSSLRPRPEEVALLVGRPVLLVPYAGHHKEIGHRVLVGWDASRAATRAVHDALPLLATASSVTVISIDPKPNEAGHGEVPGADIALHLARHGVAAHVESTVSDGIGVGNVLLSRASDLECDLLVMGAYGHSRIRERLLGGATRSVLESLTLPTLMAH